MYRDKRHGERKTLTDSSEITLGCFGHDVEHLIHLPILNWESFVALNIYFISE